MTNQARATNCKCQTASLALRSDLLASPWFSRSSLLAPRSSRPAFTLIELLISILIISILPAALLGVAAVASENAREAKTRSMISRIHTLLMEQYDTYKSRRVKVRQKVLSDIDANPSINSPPNAAAKKGSALQLARLYALRELMLMELPCCWSDVILNKVPANPTGYNDALLPAYLDPLTGALGGGAINYRTPLSALYLRQYNQIANNINKLTGVKNTHDQIVANEGAECLYMVIMNACGDGEAKTLFSETTIGDVDGDGAPEFLDGWGHPISFIRWAPGFISDIQLNANDLGVDPPVNVGDNTTWENAAKADHDPFDLFRVDIAAFRLVPLIISTGRDESFGIHIPPDVVWQGVITPSSPSLNPLSPYNRVNDINPPASVYIGTDDGSKAATDNIHNHLISTR